MELELLLSLLVRLGGLFLIGELLIFALNPIPDTPEKWRMKKHNVIRRLCYYAALSLAAAWIVTL